jgi:hypothetical protein
MVTIVNWRDLINKPVYSSDRKEVGVVSDVQPMHIIATSGPITPDKYNIPRKSVDKFEGGTVYLNVDSKFIEENYQFE